MGIKCRPWTMLLFGVFGCRGAEVTRPSTIIDVGNPSDAPREAAGVTVSIPSLGAVNPYELSAYEGNTELPVQVDDLDSNGIPDALAFQVNLGPREHKSIRLEQKPPSRFPRRAHAVVHPEFEGPGWESELIAYRMYLDGRNAIDVFGKAEPSMALDQYAHSGKTYHDVQPWGVDVLHVGETLGCGSFGIWQDGAIVKPTETLRTEAPNNSLRRFVQIVADGPVRSIVRFVYDYWVVENAPRRIVATMTIWAGKRWASSDLDVGKGMAWEGGKWVRHDLGVNEGFRPTLAVGIVALKGAPVTRKDGFFYTFGVQSDPISDTKKREALGLGVVFNQQDLAGFVDEAPTAGALAPNDRSHVALLMPDPKGHLTWAYLATWERGSLGVHDAAAMERQCVAARLEITAPTTAMVR